MAFIAGYVAARPQHTEAILKRVHGFSILPSESGAATNRQPSRLVSGM